uniref:Uncharacterized protein n=1 Tax=Oryza brachyantha TaxID=4533 RepID=J3M6Y0_ORYBR
MASSHCWESPPAEGERSSTTSAGRRRTSPSRPAPRPPSSSAPTPLALKPQT